jgi:hypothetical protein
MSNSKTVPSWTNALTPLLGLQVPPIVAKCCEWTKNGVGFTTFSIHVEDAVKESSTAGYRLGK